VENDCAANVELLLSEISPNKVRKFKSSKLMYIIYLILQQWSQLLFESNVLDIAIESFAIECIGKFFKRNFDVPPKVSKRLLEARNSDGYSLFHLAAANGLHILECKEKLSYFIG